MTNVSAYRITASDEPSMQKGAILCDKGNQLVRVWTVMNWATEQTTSAVGRRVARLCAECFTEHRRVGLLGHAGDCGTASVVNAAKVAIGSDAK